jgi:hypothetical protein
VVVTVSKVLKSFHNSSWSVPSSVNTVSFLFIRHRQSGLLF